MKRFIILVYSKLNGENETLVILDRSTAPTAEQILKHQPPGLTYDGHKIVMEVGGNASLPFGRNLKVDYGTV